MKKYVSDENCLIEWEGNGLERVSPESIKGMIQELEAELAERGEKSIYREALEKIGTMDADDLPNKWGMWKGRAEACAAIAREALSA